MKIRAHTHTHTDAEHIDPVDVLALQLMDDQGSVWAESVSDTSADSEDSNAEGYYANSYPDEDTEDSSKANSSDSDEEGWNRHGGSEEEY